METFKFIIVAEDGTSKLETTDKELAQQASMMLDGFRLIMIDPRGGIWKFSGMNAWAEAAEAAEIIGE